MLSRALNVKLLQLHKQFLKTWPVILCPSNGRNFVVSSRQLYENTFITGSCCRRWFSESVQNNLDDVNYDHVKRAVSNPNVLIVDVREPDEVKEHGKIPNSINIPLGNISNVLNRMSEKEFHNIYQKQKPNENTEIIFYCMIGKRSAKAQLEARNLGFKNAKNYLGSWNVCFYMFLNYRALHSYFTFRRVLYAKYFKKALNITFFDPDVSVELHQPWSRVDWCTVYKQGRSWNDWATKVI